MKISFLGATKTVTGSNFLVEGAGKKFMVDCGMYQGKITDELENEAPFMFNVQDIDFVLLTHAHIDHSGRIPKLYKEGYRKPIYATKATCDLCAIMLPDSGHIQEQETEWQNRKRLRRGEDTVEPMYTAQDAIDCMEVFEPVSYDEIIEITENIHVRYNDAGHMLGSAIIEVWIDEDGKRTKIVFTGDLGNNDIPLLSSPTMIDDADYLVMESTYGDRLHMRQEGKAQTFLDIVAETIERGGTVVIPSFAVGRTQEILYEINMIKDEKMKDPKFAEEYQTLMKTPVYVDSPLAISATEVFKNNSDLFDDETKELILSGDNPLEFPGLKFTQTADESKALNESDEPSVIISASGMCEVGRIKHHLKHNIWNPNSTILFVGYQSVGTLGRTIVDGAKQVKIFGEEFKVNARIEYIEGYSGHADQEWLLNFIYSFIRKPKHIFLVHGEPKGQLVLKDKITENVNIPVTIPGLGEEYSLGDDGEVKLVNTIEHTFTREEEKAEIVDKMSDLESKLVDMQMALKDDMFKHKANNDDVKEIKNKVKDLESLIQGILNNKG
jgi:metallo-beta-lactamase family protein